MERSEYFIDRYKDVLRDGGEFMNYDSHRMSRSSYYSSDVRVLIIFPSTVQDKRLSLTASVINSYVQESLPGVFVDFGYLPSKDDLGYYDRERIPYCLGSIMHLDASHYDFVGFSVSVLYELYNVGVIIGSFSRCDRAIPLSWSERKGLGLSACPVVYMGGSSSIYGDILFGSLGDGRTSYLDFIQVGGIEGLGDMVSVYRGYRGLCGVCHDGYVHALWDLGYSMIWQPQRYSYVFEGGVCGRGVRTDSSMPDRVTAVRDSKVFGELLGSSKFLVRGDGSNCGESVLYGSDGCGYRGLCSFCGEGWFRNGFREQGHLRAKELGYLGRGYSCGDSLKVYGYNMNYEDDWVGLVYSMLGYYGGVTYSNMRMREMVEDEEGLGVLGLSGVRRVASPIEGISGRLRDGLLNKGLTWAQIDRWVLGQLSRGLYDIKVGLIWTGYEECSDWSEFYSHLRLYRERLGGLGVLRCVGTPLVHYCKTPLWYIGRRSGKLSLEDGLWIPTEWNSRIWGDLGVRIRTNGFRYSTFLEQVLLDGGREWTGLYHRDYVLRGRVIYSLRGLRGSYLDRLLGYYWGSVGERFFGGRDLDSQGGLQGCLDLGNDFLLEREGGRLQSYVSGGLGDAYGVTTRCMRVYGVSYGSVCDGCGSCGGRYDLAIGRKVSRSVSLDLFKGLRRVSEGGVWMFRFSRERGYGSLGGLQSVYSSMSKVLLGSSYLLRWFKGILPYSSCSGQSRCDGVRSGYSGVILYEVSFRSGYDFGLLESELGRVLGGLRGYGWRYLGHRYVGVRGVLGRSDYVLYRFRVGVSLEVFMGQCIKNAGTVQDYSGGLWVYEEGVSGVRVPLYRSDGAGGVEGLFMLSSRWSPWHYLRGLLRGLHYESSLVRSLFIESLGVYRDSGVSGCRICGGFGSGVLEDVWSGVSTGMCIGCLERYFYGRLFDGRD